MCITQCFSTVSISQPLNQDKNDKGINCVQCACGEGQDVGGESNVIGIEGKECFQKERMWLAMAEGFYFCQNLNFSFAFCVMFNKCCINIYISNCNNNIILHSSWAKLSMIVSTILN